MNKLLSINYSLYLGVFFVASLLFLTIFGPMLAPHPLTEMLETEYTDGTILSPPLGPFESKDWLLGTNQWGYDILSMILNGIRYTVLIALAVTVIKMTIGTIVGLYIGTWKKAPAWLAAFENAWSYVPLFLILYFFLMPISFDSPIEPTYLVFYFIIITSALSIPSIISSVRLKSSEFYKSVFIEASKVLGARRNRLVWKHIFPQMKESLLVMFILEIVFVITVMGQLALLNIFIGGTRVSYDPIIYHSITNELSGLVGQASVNIYGNQHILMIPLFVLLFTTLSFSLLANGLKNRFQSDYQRAPWIKTGQEPRLEPRRKQYEERTKLWPPTGEKLGLVILAILFVSAGAYTYITKDHDIGVKNYSKASYDLTLSLDEQGEFKTIAKIDVKNRSEEEWKELVFYLIPNSFKEGHFFQKVKGFSTVKINSVKVDGAEVHYTLSNDTFIIELPGHMKKGDKTTVVIDYQFTVPEEGSRFSKVKGNYYLAQWYPMLATFQDGKWNKEEYMEGFETYHTDFSNYKISYKLPEGYSFVSTADHDPKLDANEGKVKVRKVRDFFIAIVKNMEVYETETNGVQIRLFTKNDHNMDPNEALALAKNALTFYQENIGKYPHDQLDIMFDIGHYMEYPGIVTINPYTDNESFYKISIVHEIAHQYFYGVVSNDPYHEAWIDEGFTEFATNMYFYLGENQGMYLSQSLSHRRMKSIKDQGLGKQDSNVPLDENKHSGYIYGQPAIKLFELIKDNHRVREKDFQVVIMEYLSDYYHHFQYKEVDTKEFIRFTKNYFQVPSGYFDDWLET